MAVSRLDSAEYYLSSGLRVIYKHLLAIICYVDNSIKMDDIKVKILERLELNNPVLIEGLPGVGLVGKLAGDHLLDELGGKKFAEIYSLYLPPQVNIQEDNTVELVNMSMYYWQNKKHDIILLLGGFQGLTPESQYRISDKILDIADELGVGRIFTLGGLGTGSITRNPKVYGAATSKNLVDELGEYGVVFRGSGAIFGASGLLLGLGMDRGIDAVCLMGETHGQIIDAKSAEAVLNVLTSMLGIEVDMTKLAEKAKETEEQMTKVSKMIDEQKKAMDRQFSMDQPTYIR
ncbi:MAG: proteasome assembly chaperone family protein [Candidatus Altiarchaeota archaeon]|nr:proteasome assembly chaperone family protein [Candidatus Altiarchaeota archaeon]